MDAPCGGVAGLSQLEVSARGFQLSRQVHVDIVMVDGPFIQPLRRSVVVHESIPFRIDILPQGSYL